MPLCSAVSKLVELCATGLCQAGFFRECPRRMFGEHKGAELVMAGGRVGNRETMTSWECPAAELETGDIWVFRGIRA